MVIEVGYWNLRGLVGFIRLLDVHTDEGIQWRTYETSKSAEWFDEKAKLIETGEIGNVKLHELTYLRKVAVDEAPAEGILDLKFPSDTATILIRLTM